MPIYEDIEQPMRDYVEEVVLNHSADGGHVERLLKFAEEEKERKEAAGPNAGKAVDKAAWRQKPVNERLTHALVRRPNSNPNPNPNLNPHPRAGQGHRSLTLSPTLTVTLTLTLTLTLSLTRSRASRSSSTRTRRRRATCSPPTSR